MPVINEFLYLIPNYDLELKPTFKFVWPDLGERIYVPWQLPSRKMESVCGDQLLAEFIVIHFLKIKFRKSSETISPLPWRIEEQDEISSYGLQPIPEKYNCEFKKD